MNFRSVSELEYIVVHHSVTPENYTVEDIRRIHLKEGYADIGYHYLITKDGLKVGRDIRRRGAHTLPDKAPFTQWDMNSISIGLCIIGNFEKNPPSDRIINETAYAIKILAKKYDIPLDKKHIIGHSDVSYTACPGQYTMQKIYQKLGLSPGRTSIYENISESNVDTKIAKTTNLKAGNEKEVSNMGSGLLKQFMVLVFLLLSLIIGNEETGNGTEKKAKVIAQAKEMMGQFGIKIPAILEFAADALLGILVDMLVKYLNNNKILTKEA